MIIHELDNERVRWLSEGAVRGNMEKDTLNLSMAVDSLFRQSSSFFMFMSLYIVINNAFCPPIVFKSS